jgi:hypothetical protein
MAGIAGDGSSKDICKAVNCGPSLALISVEEPGVGGMVGQGILLITYIRQSADDASGGSWSRAAEADDSSPIKAGFTEGQGRIKGAEDQELDDETKTGSLTTTEGRKQVGRRGKYKGGMKQNKGKSTDTRRVLKIGQERGGES